MKHENLNQSNRSKPPDEINSTAINTLQKKYSKKGGWPIFLSAIIATTLLTGCASALQSRSSTPDRSSHPTAGATSETATSTIPSPQRDVKFLTIIEENESRDQALSQMPYLSTLNQKYASATNFQAQAHPSLPNYLALSDGSTYGITDDNDPASHPIISESIFEQALASGLTAKVYAESMPRNCDPTNSGVYAVRHTAWPYFVNEKKQCEQYDVPMKGNFQSDLRSEKLPNIGWLIPNVLNDGHDTDPQTADIWLKQEMPQILQSPDYTSGKLVVIVTFDEGADPGSQNIVFTMVNKKLEGLKLTKPLSAYSLLRLEEETLGLPLLNNAKTAPSMTQQVLSRLHRS